MTNPQRTLTTFTTSFAPSGRTIESLFNRVILVVMALSLIGISFCFQQYTQFHRKVVISQQGEFVDISLDKRHCNDCEQCSQIFEAHSTLEAIQAFCPAHVITVHVRRPLTIRDLR